MEFLNHFFGTCGEFHPNIFTSTLLIWFGLTLYKGFKVYSNKIDRS